MKKNITDIIAALLVLLFVYAACSKLLNYNQFILQLRQQPLFGAFAGLTAWLLPATEFVTVILLTLPRTRYYGLILSLFLLAVFTGYIAAMLLSGLRLPCSCGGIISSLSWKEHLVLNLFFMGLGITGLVLEKKQVKSLQVDKRID